MPPPRRRRWLLHLTKGFSLDRPESVGLGLGARAMEPELLAVSLAAELAQLLTPAQPKPATPVVGYLQRAENPKAHVRTLSLA